MDPFKRHLKRVVNKTWNYAGRANSKREETTNAVLGFVGEAGEIADLHKKMWFHGEKDRTEELKLELGDAMYYFTKILDLYGFSLDEILDLNYQKLKARYPDHFRGSNAD